MKKRKRNLLKGAIVTWIVVFLAIAIFNVAAVMYTLFNKVTLYLTTLDPHSTRNFEIVLLAKNPYAVAQVLMLQKADERTVGEIALQSVITEKTAKEDRDVLDSSVRNYLDGLHFQYYNVKIIKGTNVLYDIDKFGRRCGKKDEGFCATPQLDFINNPSAAYPCGVGRTEIEADGKCPSIMRAKGGVIGFPVCCKEDVKEGTEIYNEPPDGKPPILRCGPNDVGICDYFCGEGRTDIDDSSNPCKGRIIKIPQQIPVAGGRTISFEPTKCCVPPGKVGTVELGRLLTAEVPLIYRTKQGAPTFYCVDPKTQSCKGELVPGLCGTGTKQCCVTQAISCKTDTGKSGFCMTTEKCRISLGLNKGEKVPSEISKSCGQNTARDYQCCPTGNLRELRTTSEILRTDDECNLGEKPTEEFGKLLVTVGGK